MKDKCTKYEALFTFADEKTLRQHIETCEDCRREQESPQEQPSRSKHGVQGRAPVIVERKRHEYA